MYSPAKVGANVRHVILKGQLFPPNKYQYQISRVYLVAWGSMISHTTKITKAKFLLASLMLKKQLE